MTPFLFSITRDAQHCREGRPTVRLFKKTTNFLLEYQIAINNLKLETYTRCITVNAGIKSHKY